MGTPDAQELTDMTKERNRKNRIERWGDKSQYLAEPHQEEESGGVAPRVTLIAMTTPPLSAMAAMSEMYKGRVVRNVNEITEDQAEKAFEDVLSTHLTAPLEAIKVHFLLEGIDRAFTHQLVRQRTAVYAQESLRFAVVENLLNSTTIPPSLDDTDRSQIVGENVSFDMMRSNTDFEMASSSQRRRMVWDWILSQVDSSYDWLVNDGMPAEEARGLLPHATATRVHYITDLRNLSDHSGNRLCTQAQFVWRDVFSQIAGQIRQFPYENESVPHEIAWQFGAIADSDLFRPVCYKLGRCPFNASFDRPCSIRNRVEKLSGMGVESERWSGDTLPAELRISPAEWLLDPAAARS